MANKKYKLSEDFWETSGVYDIEQDKTQREINKTAMDTAEPKTVTGNNVTVNDGVEGVPVRKLIANITPAQEGSGDPSPSNVRNISGWTGVEVRSTGVNLWGGSQMLYDAQTSLSPVTVDGSEVVISVSSSQTTLKRFLKHDFKENTQYTLKLRYKNDTISSSRYIRPNLAWYYTDGTYDAMVGDRSGISANTYYDFVFVSAANKTLAAIGRQRNSGNATIDTAYCGLFEGVKTVDDFVPFEGTSYSVAFPNEVGTVYGGTLDVVSGVLTVDKVAVDMGDLHWGYASSSASFRISYSYISPLKVSRGQTNIQAFCTSYKVSQGSVDDVLPDYSIYIGNSSVSSSYGVFLKDSRYTSVSDFTTAVTGQTLVYTVETPTVYQLTPAEVNMFLGQNNFWADAGTVTLEYGAYLTTVSGKAGEKVPKVMLAPVERTTTASKAYSVNELFFMGDKLYIATAAIASGATFTVGTNCDETTIGAILTSLLNA